jgi:hypothetical protein
VNADIRQLAQRFAAILDKRDYDSLVRILTAGCKYEFRDRVVEGSTHVIEEYRNATEWAFDALDRIEFASQLAIESPNSARITFIDRLYSGDAVHEYRCQQVVTVDDSGQIIHIRHVDLDGQAAALDAFFEKCGIVRPRPDAPGIIASPSGP